MLRRVNLSVRQLGALVGALGVNTGSFLPPLSFSGESLLRNVTSKAAWAAVVGVTSVIEGNMKFEEEFSLRKKRRGCG